MSAAPGFTPPDEKWFEDMVRCAADYALISLREDRTIFAWNPGAERLFLFRSDEVLGQSGDLIFTSEDIENGIPELEFETARARGSSLDERWHVRKDRTRVWASGRLLRVDDREGRLRGFVKIVRDRTADKATHDAMLEAVQRYRLVSLATNDVIWDWDLVTNELQWNEATEVHFGVRPEELGPDFELWKTRVHPDDRARVVNGLQSAIAGDSRTWSDRYRFLTKGGAYETYFDRGIIARDEHGRALRMIGSMLNITHDRRAENSLREAQARIERQNAQLEARVAQRTRELTAALRDLEEFAYSMSHDLKGAATTLRALVDILHEEKPAPREAEEIVVRIHRNASTLCVLIDEMLRFSEIGLATPEIRTIDLDAIVRQVIAEVREANPAIISRINVRGRLGSAAADPVLLAHAVRNLVSNALKFVAPEKQPSVELWIDHQPGHVRLHVADNGIGIDPRFRDQVFELFRRLHHARKYPGYGVGLATVKRAVEKLGGEVSFESVVGKGTVFTIALPDSSPDTAAPEAKLAG